MRLPSKAAVHSRSEPSRSAEPCSPFSSRAIPALMVNVNLAPFPSSESIHILPPIIVTIRFDIASPRPVPPYFLDVLLLVCTNDSKRRDCCSGDTPIPVSETVISTTHSSPDISRSRAGRPTCPPADVNLAALESRLVMTWERRCSSPIRKSGMPASTTGEKS